MFKKTIFAALATLALSAQAQNLGFETGDITGWTSSTLTATGTQTLQAGPNAWVINPYGNYMGTLQIANESFDTMTNALGLNSTSVSGITTLLQQQAQSGGGGNPTPTTAGYVTRTVTLTAGTQFSLAWQYISVDYVPFNDGSIATLTKVNSTGTTVVNNYNSQYALLGFTNPGTGDYSTGSYGATGWQVATFNVTEDGDYLLGFGVFNLGDTALSPILYIDEVQGSTSKNGETFGAVAPNNDTAPSAPPEPPPSTPSAPTVVSTTSYNHIVIAEIVDANQSPTSTASFDYANSKASGLQTINRTTTTSVNTPWIRTISTTPVTTTTYSDDSLVTTQGSTSQTIESFNVIATSTANDSFSGRADQVEQFDIIRSGIYRNLNRNSAKYGVASENGRMAINVTGIKYAGQNSYAATSSIAGFAYETDVNPDLIVGFQVNKISSKLDGSDTSNASLTGTHVGVYADVELEGFTIQNDLARVNTTSRYSRTIGPFVNDYSNKTNITWLSTRAYTPSVEGFRPFIGASVYKANTPAVSESGSVESAQSMVAKNTTGTTGEVGVSYSAKVYDATVTTEFARTTSGVKEAILNVSKTEDNLMFTIGLGKTWIDNTTSNIVSANLKIKF
jgi:hypothetical protein